MQKFRTYNKRKLLAVFIVISVLVVCLFARLTFLMINRANYYGNKAVEVRERERKIKALRGTIYDRNNVVLATNKSVCTISVIHSQIKEPEKVIKILSDKLNIPEENVRKRVEKISSIEKIKSNVDKKIADEIRNADLKGVMVDEDYKRTYPFDSLASKVIGFTGGDNQGILGLESKYEKYLKGVEGKILTTTTANGIEVDKEAERRIEPIPGYDLHLTLDSKIQEYAEYLALKVMEEKSAKNVKITIMNPQNGEILAMVNVPEFNLNKPYEYNKQIDWDSLNDKEQNKLLNEMWRNATISDTYEPGSTFKIVTATAALEEKVVKVEDRFNCPGFKIVEDRKIRCHKVGGHGAQNFKEGIMNSCNPVFIEVGARVGAENMYKEYRKLGLFNKTGIDVPGEANSIMHNIKNIKPVELATMSFGQSIQITPLQLLVAASAVANGGNIVTPHFAKSIQDKEQNVIKEFDFAIKQGAVSKETSDTMKELLEAVVAEGSGKNAYLEGYRVGGKTATSEKLPRRTGKYISSFLGFTPANNPTLIGIILIDEPVGIYYGGTIAAPVIAKIFKNILNIGNQSLIISQ